MEKGLVAQDYILSKGLLYYFFTYRYLSLNRSPGRPMLDIFTENIEYLRGLNFILTKISNILGISQSTLYRHLEVEGINCTETHSTVTNNEFDDLSSKYTLMMGKG